MACIWESRYKFNGLGTDGWMNGWMVQLLDNLLGEKIYPFYKILEWDISIYKRDDGIPFFLLYYIRLFCGNRKRRY